MAADSLPHFIEQVTGESHLRVEKDLGDGFVRLLSSEAERRQAKHDVRCVEDIVIEMLRNARDAGAHLIYLATTREGTKRLIVMIDDGQGIPEHLQDAVFEPRVTSKLDTYHMDRWGIHGRGMALYAVKMNTDSAEVVASEPGMGTSFRVITDATKLPERTDQSSLPRLVQSDEGRPVMRGPRNINRMVAEFVTESPDAPQVYVGSPIQIAATLYRTGREALGALSDTSGVPLCLRLAAASHPGELAVVCQSLGLEMSERSARRIMDGEIAPLPPFLSLLGERESSVERPLASSTDASISPHPTSETHAVQKDVLQSMQKRATRSFKPSSDDLERFATAVQQAWVPIAHAYYLDAEVAPQVRVTKDGVRVFIPTAPDQDAY